MARREKDEPAPTSTDELLTVSEVCAFFGGDRPISRSTLYLGIRNGYFPRPLHLTKKIRRWSKKACEKSLVTASKRYRGR